MATHSSILAWRILWTGEPGRLQSMGSQRDRHNRMTNTLLQQFFYTGSLSRFDLPLLAEVFFIVLLPEQAA